MDFLLYAFIFLGGVIAGIFLIIIGLQISSKTPSDSSTIIIPFSLFLEDYEVSQNSWNLNNNYVQKTFFHDERHVSGAENYSFNKKDTYLYHRWNNKRIKTKNKNNHAIQIDVFKEIIRKDKEHILKP